jgi:hypothetical protein
MSPSARIPCQNNIKFIWKTDDIIRILVIVTTPNTTIIIFTIIILIINIAST